MMIDSSKNKIIYAAFKMLILKDLKPVLVPFSPSLFGIVCSCTTTNRRSNPVLTGKAHLLL